MFKKHRFKIISAIAVIGLAFANSGTLVQKSRESLNELPATKAYKSLLGNAKQDTNSKLTGLKLYQTDSNSTLIIDYTTPTNYLSTVADSASNVTLPAATVDNLVTSIKLSPVDSNAPANNISVTVDSNSQLTVSGSNGTYTISGLAEGDNIIYVNVAPNGGTFTRVYKITVHRISAKCNLLSFSLGSVVYSPTFSSGTTIYNASVANEVGTVTVSATADPYATIKVNDSPIGANNSSTIPLKTGPNAIIILVTAEDNKTTKTYTLNINRAKSNISTLTGLYTEVNGTRSNDNIVTIPNYRLNVSTSTLDVGLIINRTEPNSTALITLDTDAVGNISNVPDKDGNLVGTISKLPTGNTQVTVIVKSEDLSSETSYIFTIHRISNNANLNSLSLSSGTLSPSFSSDVSNYSVSVANQVKILTITPVADSTATVKVNNAPLSGQTANIDLLIGSNTINIDVQAEEGTLKSYTLNVYREAATDLINLTLSKLPTAPGTNLTLSTTLTTTGSINPLVYQVWIQDADDWRIVKNFDEGSDITNNTDTPAITTFNNITISSENLTLNNQYKVFVRIKDSKTGVIYAQKTEMATCVEPQLKLDKITAVSDTNVEGQGTVNGNVVITAYGTEIDEYQFSIGNGFTWDVKRAYDASKTYTWTPDKPGNFTIRVRARKKDSDQFKEMTIPFDILANATSSYNYFELQGVDIPSTLNVDDTTTLKATGIGGESEADRQYNFTIGEEMRTPTTTSGYKTAAPTYNWKPTKPGIYQIFAFIKDADSTTYEDGIRRFCTVTRTDGSQVKISEVRRDKTNSTYGVNETINFEVIANTLNDSTTKYSFWRLEDKGYRLIKDYKDITEDPEANKLSWTPAKPGTYTILVRVKDKNSGSYEDQSSFTYTITDPQTSSINISGLDVQGTNKKRTNHVITATAVNGSTSDTLLYKFVVTDNDFGWRTIQEFSPKNSCNWLPKKAGNYKVLVWVKDNASGSYEKEKVIPVTIN